MSSKARTCRARPPAIVANSPSGDSGFEPGPQLLDPDRLSDHIDRLYRAAWALCGSRHEAEDLVQDTFLNVLKRPRLLRDGNEIGYLLRALRNTHANRYRAAARRPRHARSSSKTTRRLPTRVASTRAKSCRRSQARRRRTEMR